MMQKPGGGPERLARVLSLVVAAVALSVVLGWVARAEILAVTHALAEAQGGSVRAERREGGGMRFVLELPRQPAGLDAGLDAGLAAVPAPGTSVPRG